MRAVLVLMLVLHSAGQFIRYNTWKIQGKDISKTIHSHHPLSTLHRKKGNLMFYPSESSLTLALIAPTDYETQYLTGLARRMDMSVDFGEEIPFHYGRIDGEYNVSVGQGSARRNYTCKVSYWPNSRIVIHLQSAKIQASLHPYSLPYLILLNICLAGVLILLLTVLLRRKRWSQMNPHFLIILLAWKIKKVMVLWFECSVLDSDCSCPGTAITQGLLLILTVKSIKIVAEVLRITNNIVKDRNTTGVLVGGIVVAVLMLPMLYLHLLIPLAYSLQFSKYNRYSRLDFEVHYTYLLLNCFISAQLLYRLINYKQELSIFEGAIVVYSIIMMTLWVVLGELYQYGESRNCSSPCLQSDFDNKRFCPRCEDELFDQLQTKANRLRSRQRSDLLYDLWKFGVADCGHIFHRHCLLQTLKSPKGCPLIPLSSSGSALPFLKDETTLVS